MSSRDVSEIHIGYELGRNNDDLKDLWSDLDGLMAEKFPVLTTVTIGWQGWEMRAREDFTSKSARALPKVYKKGILRTVLPFR